jgi:hypothetical protein
MGALRIKNRVKNLKNLEYGKFWDTSTNTQGLDIKVDRPGPRPRGTTTQARLTLLDAWPDANETSHGRPSHLGEVLAARSSVSQPFI